MQYIGRREELDGKIVKLELEDLDIVLAPDYEKGVVRDKEPWCNINFTFWDGQEERMLHIHEWEDDDTDYEQEDAPAGKIYYNIYSYEGGQWVEEDGGVMAYEFRETLGDWLWNTLGITAEDFCD